MAVRFPTSAAYWNLRAEQVMNKVFEADPVEPIDVAIEEPAVYSSAPVMDSRPAASKTPLGLDHQTHGGLGCRRPGVHDRC